MERYLMIEDAIEFYGNEDQKVFDTLEEAEKEARYIWDRLTKSEQKKTHVYVALVKEEYLNKDLMEDDELDWTVWDRCDPIGFDSDNL